MSKIVFVFGVFFVSLMMFLNLGNILDVSQNPKKSDVIISLGGDDNDRIKKAIDLYKNDFTKEKLILITGGTDFTKKDMNQDSRIKYINSLNENINFEYNSETRTTLQEIKYLKKYMNENYFSSAIIVSDPYHMLRIKMLVSLVGFEDKQICLVRTNPSFWNDKKFYENNLAMRLALTEVVKIPYNFMKYIIF